MRGHERSLKKAVLRGPRWVRKCRKLSNFYFILTFLINIPVQMTVKWLIFPKIQSVRVEFTTLAATDLIIKSDSVPFFLHVSVSVRLSKRQEYQPLFWWLECTTTLTPIFHFPTWGAENGKLMTSANIFSANVVWFFKLHNSCQMHSWTAKAYPPALSFRGDLSFTKSYWIRMLIYTFTAFKFQLFLKWHWEIHLELRLIALHTD